MNYKKFFIRKENRKATQFYEWMLSADAEKNWYLFFVTFAMVHKSKVIVFCIGYRWQQKESFP